MGKDEALRLALEALEAALSDDQPYIKKNKQAITTIKEALVEPEVDYRAMYLKVRDELASLQQCEWEDAK